MQSKVAIGLLLAVSLATSGCVQAVTGGPIAFEASPAGVSDDALQQTGYEVNQQDDFTINRTVDVPAVGERRVRISNHIASHSRTASNGEGEDETKSMGGVFLVLSTPQAQVAGQGTNPLGRMPMKDLIEQVASRAGDQNDVEHVDEHDLTVLGTTATAEKFSSTTKAEGQEVETFIYVVRVGHGDDYVVGVGILPKALEDDEDTIYELMRGLQHSGN